MNIDLPVNSSTAARQRWMACLARAPGARLAALAGACELPRHTVLRGPEVGLVMTRGRMGGGGGLFNLGEMTVTRCSVRTLPATGEGVVGHAWVAGRDTRHAELAAVLDAALQGGPAADALWHDVIAPLEAEEAARRQALAERAAATRVDFFTLATMRS